MRRSKRKARPARPAMGRRAHPLQVRTRPWAEKRTDSARSRDSGSSEPRRDPPARMLTRTTARPPPTGAHFPRAPVLTVPPPLDVVARARAAVTSPHSLTLEVCPVRDVLPKCAACLHRESWHWVIRRTSASCRIDGCSCPGYAPFQYAPKVESCLQSDPLPATPSDDPGEADPTIEWLFGSSLPSRGLHGRQ